MIGRTLSHFRILAKIGKGGMGVVYRAEDTKLRRQVALKVLPPELVGNEERRLRFLREARAAAAVTHPNIATIYEVDEADGVVFIAMELVEGKTLREQIGGRPMAIKDALRIATEMAEGLAEAHKAGVIHRDLKPDNVIIHSNGHPKILDFGLAKLKEERGDVSTSEVSKLETISGELTREGKVFGTVAYMSPEQARGRPVDSRSDQFSFGTTLYEMATGRVPFRGETSADTLSAILRDEPAPPSEINGEVPLEFERIIGKCLEKDPEERYHDTRDLVVDLRKLKRVTESGAQAVHTPSGPQAIAPSSGWTRLIGTGTRRAVLAAGLAVMLIAGGFAWWRVTREPGGFKSGDSVFVVDFDNPSGQPMFDTAVRDAFEDMLGMSRFLEVVPRDRVQDLAGSDTAGHTRQIDQELATQICGKGNWAGYLAGEIVPEDGGYRIVASLHHCGRREPLIARAAVAREEGDVLMAIHEIAIGIRKALGEVPDAISATTPPTTRSLPAYQALVLARRVGAQGRGPEAIALGQRALEIDPDFVEAYSDLALNYGALFKWKEYRRFAEEAFRRSAGLPEPIRLTNELLFLEAWYEIDEVVAKLKKYLALYPPSPDKANWLTFIQLWSLQDPAAAEVAARAAYEMLRDVGNLLDVAQCLAYQGKLAEIEALVEKHRRNGGTSEECDAAMLFLHLARGNFDKIREIAKRLELDPGSMGYWALGIRLWGALAAGRLQEAETFSVSNWRRGREQQEGALQSYAGMYQVWLEARRSGKSSRLTPGSLRPMRNRLLALGNLATLSVDVGLAEPLSQEIQRHQVAEKDSKSRFVREALEFGRACLALIRGEPEAAIEILEPIARNSIRDQHHHVLAKAYGAAGKWRRAAGQYERMLEQPYRKFLFYNPAEWVLDQFRLARIYERLGDTDRARHWYERFLTDWKDADPDIPELIEARKRMAALGEAGTVAVR